MMGGVERGPPVGEGGKNFSVFENFSSSLNATELCTLGEAKGVEALCV